jgi:hypothetical protein
MTTVVIVGCGPSLADVAWPASAPRDVLTLACNRAIEAVPADVWLWVDRMHYDRSRWHPHARRARRIGAGGEACADASRVFGTVRELPGASDELYLRGGTLTPATHYALRELGARRIVFVACDAWSEGRTRWHEWDGAPLDEAGVALHRNHLLRTAVGVRELAGRHPEVEFLDATPGGGLLGWPHVDLAAILPGPAVKAPRPQPDLALPRGYGRLAGVTPAGPGEAILWMEDADKGLRAVRVALDREGGLALVVLGEARVVRN